MSDPSVAIVHDYLTQRGGAERVVLAMARAFPDAPIHTSMYEPTETFPEFGDLDVRVTALDRVRPLRRRHRVALPFLASAFSRQRVKADVLLCSSSGWAHGAGGSGRRIVYCHTPARWLYPAQPGFPGFGGAAGRLAMRALGPPLRRWDRAAADRADVYLVNSREVADRVDRVYGRSAELVPPPMTLDVDGPTRAVASTEPGFFLCVSRLLSYKHVDRAVAAFAELPEERLVVVGEGPFMGPLLDAAPDNVRLIGTVDDATLRWLYEHCAALIAPAHEDFGLTPIEAAAFGRPTVALRWGGYLDTIVEDETGLFFDAPEAEPIAAAIRALRATEWSPDRLREQAGRYGEPRFVAHLRGVVARVAAQAATGDGPSG